VANWLAIRPYRESDERSWVVCRVLSFLDSAFFDDVRQANEHYEHPAIELVAERAGKIVGSSTSSAKRYREPCARIDPV
jgi:hypothetical protein